jgi:tRNA-binding protein
MPFKFIYVYNIVCKGITPLCSQEQEEGEETVLTYEDFEKVDMRVGKIIKVERNEKARKPSYKMWIDLGEELGIRQSSGQYCDNYTPEDLVNQLVICVVNFPSKRIAGFKSEVLVLGAKDQEGNVVFLKPERPVPLGERIF